MKDSGNRENFTTGAVRDIRSGKGRFDLISPIALRRLAKWMELGALKYGDRNWEKGMPVSRCLDSALRHLNNHLLGLRDEDHLSAAMFNIQAIVHIEEMVQRGLLPQDLLDWPSSYLDSPEDKD